MRDRLLKLGCPCSIAAPAGIGTLLPVPLVVTWSDVFDDVRRTPYDDTFVLSIGPGFVNTALNAQRTENEETALSDIRAALVRFNKIRVDPTCPFGVFLSPGVFLARDFCEIRGSIIRLTAAENLLFTYLFTCTDAAHPAASDKIAAFCGIEPPSVPVQIAHLNKKAEDAIGQKLITSIRRQGYYAVKQ